MTGLTELRNIGISAHIDSGKTTLTERILFYSGRIHRMNEVRGRDGSGAVMDYMELEREKGITITSATTQVDWAGRRINVIDTPGHVDFTIEVERSLRVLDGAVFVLCGVGGVQSQSLTVDRQMRRYGVPRLAFINKLDRTGADPAKVIKQMEEKLGLSAVPMQIPVGAEGGFRGVVDLVDMQAVEFDGEQGELVRRGPVPAALLEPAIRARQAMLEAAAMHDEELMSIVLAGGEPPAELIHKAIRRATVAREIVPVFMGSAYKNKGVQPLLDGIVRYLPAPLDRQIFARDMDNDGAETMLSNDADAPLVAMAFKLIQESFGQLTYMRLYQGKAVKGGRYVNTRTGKPVRFSRIVRMHADQRQELEQAGAGDIVAVVGVDCAGGDTFCAEGTNLALESIHVPKPVITQAVAAARRQDADRLDKALDRFRREDPTFHVLTDKQTGEILIAGMGELHLEIYVERIRREYGVDVVVTPPKVSYRESPTVEVNFNYRHRKQTGGRGQYAHIIGRMVPLPDDAEEPYVFEETVYGGRIPAEYVPSVDRGFQQARMKGPLAGFEVAGVKMVLEDGSFHDVDSSDMAFQICAADCFRETFLRSRPALREPIMKVEVESPPEFQGAVIGDLNARRGMILHTEDRGGFVVISAEVPLAEMFGYSTDVRSMSQGKAGFTMEFASYRRVPAAVQEEIVRKVRAEAARAR